MKKKSIVDNPGVCEEATSVIHGTQRDRVLRNNMEGASGKCRISKIKKCERPAKRDVF